MAARIHGTIDSCVVITLDRFRTDEVSVVWRAEEPSPDEIVPSMEPE